MTKADDRHLAVFFRPNHAVPPTGSGGGEGFGLPVTFVAGLSIPAIRCPPRLRAGRS